MGDVNNDGWCDLYVTNDYDEQDFLYINQKNGHFKEVTEESFGHLSKFSMGSNIVDLNNDLRSDLITLDMLPESNERQKLLKGPTNMIDTSCFWKVDSIIKICEICCISIKEIQQVVYQFLVKWVSWLEFQIPIGVGVR
jgi:hypothetical protein